MKTILVHPGANSANTELNFPANTPPVASIESAVQINAGQYSSGSDVAPIDLTVVDSGASTDEIQLDSEGSYELGNALIATDLVLFNVNLVSDNLQTS